MISDWVHETAFIVYGIEMAGNGAPPADSIVINGKGHYNNNGTVTGSYFETTFQKGKKHILRLINGSAGASYIFAIDGHDLEVISNDLVAIEPFTVSSLFIGIGKYSTLTYLTTYLLHTHKNTRRGAGIHIAQSSNASELGGTGQRYTVVVQAKNETEKPGDYWMRTAPADCATFQQGNPPDQRTGIIRYDPSSTALPLDLNPLTDTTCADVSTELLNPIVPWCVDQHPQNNVTEDTYEAAVQTAVPDQPDQQLGPPGHPYKHWFLGDRPMWLNFSEPTILNVDESIANENYTVIQGKFPMGSALYFLPPFPHWLDQPAGRLCEAHTSLTQNLSFNRGLQRRVRVPDHSRTDHTRSVSTYLPTTPAPTPTPTPILPTSPSKTRG